MVITAFCAGTSAFIFEASPDLGHGQFGPFATALIAAIAGGCWAFLVSPKMGRSWVLDCLWIAAAYPSVGAFAGFMIAFGQPIGIPFGAYLAITLPLLFPKSVLPIYILGAIAAFLLPRALRNS